MAKREWTVRGDFDSVLQTLHAGVLKGSISATFEDGSDYRAGESRYAVRVYERYSYAGGNRLSLTLALAGEGEDLFLSAITSGGSQAVFFKINTWGEESFLDRVGDIVGHLPYAYSIDQRGK